MNGILVLLTFSMLAQSGIGPLGAGLPATQSSAIADPSAGLTQYGWQINSQNELEYLIQISPEMLPFMTSVTDQKEFQSEIPKELVGRIQRVVVSIGTQILPRTPSLQEIPQRVPVIASLPGRFRDLEPDAPVANVNNNQFPQPPGSLGSNADRSSTLSGSPPIPTTPLGGTFMDQARSGNANSSSSAGRSTPGSPALPGSGAANPATAFNSNQSTPPPALPGGFNNQAGMSDQQGRFADTARPNPSAMPTDGSTGNWAASQNPVAPQWPSGPTSADPYALGGTQPPAGYPNAAGSTAPNYQPGNAAQTGWASQPGNHQPTYNQPGYNQPGYNQPNGYAQPPAYAQHPNFAQPPANTSAGGDYGRPGAGFPGTATGGFGDPPGSAGQSLADRTRGTDRWGNAVTAGPPAGRPGDTLVASRPRDSQNLSDSTLTARDPMSASSGMESSSSHHDLLQRQTVAAKESNNYHLFVFFVLSVAVNLWMVHLLRSLYLRYRTLLTSLRSQTA